MFSRWMRRTAGKSRPAKKRRPAPQLRGPSPLRPSFESLDRRILLSAGSLDPTFGSGGVVNTSPPDVDQADDQAYASAEAIQPDGKIVVAGSAGYVPASYFLARYNSDGSLDPTFGTGGMVLSGYPFVGSTPSEFVSVALQPDGKILAVGDGDILRFNTDGTLDTSYGNSGVFTSPVASQAVAIDQLNGDIVLAVSDYGDGLLKVAEVTSAGALDQTFGTNGIASCSASAITATSVAVEADGSIMVGQQGPSDGGAYFCHFSETGNFLSTLAPGIAVGTQTNRSELTAQPDGETIAVVSETSETVIAEFDELGRLNTTFGVDGIAVVPVQDPGPALVESNGAILVAGSTASNGNGQIAVALFNANGTLDQTFGSGGRVVTQVGSDASARAIELDSNGRIVVAGYGTASEYLHTAVVARYLNEPPATVGLPDITAFENTGASVNLFAAFSDPFVSASGLNYSIADDTNPGVFSSLAISQTTGYLTLDYTTAGTASLKVRATDPAGQYVEAAFTVTVYTGEPSFTVGSNVTVDEVSSAGSAPIEFAGWATGMTAAPGDPNTPAFTFQVTQLSGTAGLFALGSVSIDSQGDLFASPNQNASGSAMFSVVMQDNGGMAGGRSDTTLTAQTFTVNVNFVNEPPQFTAGGNQTVYESSGPITINTWSTGISAGPASESSQTVAFQLTDDSPQLFSTQPAISPYGTLTFAPNPNSAGGTASITVALKDNGGTANGGNDTSPTQTFTITILPVNHAPSFALGPAITLSENVGQQIDTGWVTQISAGAPYESAQTLNFAVSTLDSYLFAVQPSIASDGTLRFVVAPGTTGTATVTVSLHDNGGTTNGGHDTSATQEFWITVNPSADVALKAVTALNSLPGAPASLYLDFTGDTTASWGTYSPGITPAYTQDSDSTTFSATELASIQQIWAQVADAFSPFNINVTTVKPADMSHGHTMQIDIGGSGSWYSSTEGGVAFVGSFANSALPNLAFVFSANFSGSSWDTAIAIEHEAGHGFGLNHQSTYNGTTLVDEYNPGDSGSAPIMGVAYQTQYARWWDGPSDVSSTTIQDDVAIIADATNGFGYRPHDAAGQSIAAATPLTLNGELVSESGVIQQASQIDYYSFTSDGGPESLDVAPLPGFGGTLNLDAQILDSSGTVLQTVTSSSSQSGIAYFDLPAGTYYLMVAGYGAYGDLGQYTIAGQLASKAVLPGVVPNVVSTGSETVNLWSALSPYMPSADVAPLMLTYSVTGDTNPALFQSAPTVNPDTGLLSLGVKSAGAAALTVVVSDGNYSVQTTFYVSSQPIAAGQLADPNLGAASVAAGNWQYDPAGSPWTFTGTAGVSGNNSAITGGNPTAPQGSQVAFIQVTGSMSQTASLAAGTYIVDFLAAQRGNYNFGGQSLQVLVDGAPVGGSITPVGTGYSLYGSTAFTVSAGMHTITIAGLDPRGGDNTALIDSISIQPSTANQLADPDFSAANMGAATWQYAPTGSTWVFIGTAGVAENGGSITGGNPNAPQGNQVAFVQFTGSLSQALSLAAGTYTIQLDAAQRGNYNHGGQSLQLLVDGTPIGASITPAGSNYALYTSATFTVTAGTHTITIVGLDPQGGDNTALVDDISLQSISTSPVAAFGLGAVSVGADNWQYDPAGSPWTFTGTAGVSGNNSAITGGNSTAPQGSQVAFIQFTGSMSQTVSLAAGTYIVDLLAAQRGNYNFGGQSLQVLVDGAPVGGSITPVGTGYSLYGSAVFTVSAGTHTITIAGLDPQGGDNTALIDSISIQPGTANQLADPDFSAANIGTASWQYAPTGSTWVFSGTAGVAENGGSITGGNPNAPQGNQVAFVQFTGSLSQALSLAAGTYTIQLDAAQRGNYNHGGQSLQLLVDGTPIGASITPAGSNYALYTSVTFAVTAGTHTITIAGLDPQGGDNTALVDDIALQTVSTSQVVELAFGATSVVAGNWQYAPAGSSWTFTGTAGVSGNNSDITGGNPTAPQGSQVGFVQFTGSMSEEVSLSAGTYTLDFLAAQRGNYNHGGQTLEVFLDGTQISGDITPAGTDYSLYGSAAFSVTSGVHTFTFKGVNSQGGDNTALVDDVSVEPVTVDQLADSDFSTSAVGAGSWQYAPAGSPWAFSGTAGVSGDNSAITGGNPAAPQGNQVAFVQSIGSISQVVSLSAETYTIEFSAAQRENYNHGGQALQVLIDGRPVGGSISPAGSSYALYSSAEFNMAPGTHTITIAGLNPQGGDNTALIDDVWIKPVTIDAVADPNFGMAAVGAGQWQYDPGNDSWTFAGAAGISGASSAITAGNPSEPGGQVAFIQSTGSISQEVSLSGGMYSLVFNAAQRGNYNFGGQTLQVLVDGVAAGSLITPAGSNYADYSAAFSAAAGTHEITIEGLDSLGGDNTALIDHVMLQYLGADDTGGGGGGVTLKV